MTSLDYTPVSHPTINGTYRVVMRKTDDGEYVIHVAQYQVRRYTDDTLPDRVKSMLSMIHAFPQRLREAWMVGSSDMFINNQTPELNDIGWQVTKNLYILVLDQEYLFQMWGNKI
jgi:hypothetical protein